LQIEGLKLLPRVAAIQDDRDRVAERLGGRGGVQQLAVPMDPEGARRDFRDSRLRHIMRLLVSKGVDPLLWDLAAVDHPDDGVHRLFRFRFPHGLEHDMGDLKTPLRVNRRDRHSRRRLVGKTRLGPVRGGGSQENRTDGKIPADHRSPSFPIKSVGERIFRPAATAAIVGGCRALVNPGPQRDAAKERPRGYT